MLQGHVMHDSYRFLDAEPIPAGKRLTVDDLAGNARRPAAIRDRVVRLVEWVPELKLAYLEDAEGSRFVLTSASEVQGPLETGLDYRAVVNDEGFALVVGSLDR